MAAFINGQSYSNGKNLSYEDCEGDWDDILSPDAYDEWLDRKRFEQSNRWPASANR